MTLYRLVMIHSSCGGVVLPRTFDMGCNRCGYPVATGAEVKVMRDTIEGTTIEGTTIEGTTIVDMVKVDLDDRVRLGIRKYGGPLTPGSRLNGKSPLLNAYEEVLDLAQYLRQQLAEEEKGMAEVGALASGGGQGS